MWNRLKSLLPWIIITFGILLRLNEYLANRSLWLDEAAYAIQIITKPLQELFKPLGSNLAAPIGYLLLQKIAISIFGTNEQALRLVPFLAGCISLLLFYKMAQYFVHGNGLLLSLGLFALSDSLVFYSAETKQYSLDVAVSIFLCILIFSFMEKKWLTAKDTVLISGIGAILLWFSQPAVFTLAGLGTALFLSALAKKEEEKAKKLILIFSIWSLSFALLYFLSLRFVVQNKGLIDYGKESFISFPPKSLSNLKLYLDFLLQAVESHIGFSSPTLITIISTLGLYTLLQKSRKKFALLIFPLLFAIIASSLKKYPLIDRFVLFLCPLTFISAALGVEKICEIIEKIIKRKALWASLAISMIFLFSSSKQSFNSLLIPRRIEETRPVLAYYKDHHRKNDLLYLYYASESPYQYYSLRFDLNDKNVIEGTDLRGQWNAFIADLNKLKGKKRVWFLFSHVAIVNESNEEEFFLRHLNKIGKKLDSQKAPGAAIYLYNLNI